MEAPVVLFETADAVVISNIVTTDALCGLDSVAVTLVSFIPFGGSAVVSLSAAIAFIIVLIATVAFASVALVTVAFAEVFSPLSNILLSLVIKVGVKVANTEVVDETEDGMPALYNHEPYMNIPMDIKTPARRW